ncbi:CaiB/BaiF CoA transferase family protein [Roseibium sp.]|uniref:CaiB/BaiF CoA transferase family protein n=1 Tax=Roseibium sp. TaxID=1936156 RepID=UPI003A9713D0
MPALDGLKIADFSWVGAGPRATKDLADNGALVIKVESRKRLDLGRMSPPFAKGDRKNPDASAFFAQTNTSKKSVTINLTDPKGVEVARKLVAWADVVVENFGPGYMERIGLGYGDLQHIKPDIILASVSVAGRTGPLGGFRGYGNSAAAYSGSADMTGWPDTPPHMTPFAYGDVVAPMFLTIAILSALEHKAETGRGCHVDVSQIEAMALCTGDLFAEMPSRKPANSDPLMAPHGVYPCAGDDAWIAIACETDDMWHSLCTVLGANELAARFPMAGDRRANLAAIDEAVAGLTGKLDKNALDQDLADAGVAAAPVIDGKELSEHVALRAAGHFLQIEHPVLGLSAMPAPPYQFSETPHHVTASPCLGADNSEVFGTFLGMSDEEISRLSQEGALA